MIVKEEDKVIPKPNVRIESDSIDYKSMNDRFDARVKQLSQSGYKQVKPNIFAKNNVGFTNKQIMRMSDDEWKDFRGHGEPVDQLVKRKENDDMDGEYEDSLKDNIGDIVMDDSLGAEEKVAKLLALVGGEADEEVNGGEDKPMDEAEDVALEIGDEEKEEAEDEKEPLKTEESIRRRKDPAIAKLLEEVDAYRARDRREKLMGEARKLCEASSLPKYAITEAFLGILSETDKKSWKTLVEDRRRVIFRGEQPVSAVATNGELTVDSLVKALRS